MTTLQRCSDHLYWTELSCADGSVYPLDWRDVPDRGLAVGRMFEDVRAECTILCVELHGSAPLRGVCLTIASGYRSPQYQAYLRTIPRLKAAKHSQHCEGRAIDIACPRELGMGEFETAVRRATAREGSPIRYVEFRPSMYYIHVDNWSRYADAAKVKWETIA
jgi:hypothetical protein